MNESDLERVLKSAGPRERPPPEVELAVRSNLRAEWRSVVADRRRRSQQRVFLAMAASICAVAIALWFAAPRMTGSTETFATVVLAAGESRVTSGWLDGWHGIAGQQVLRTGQTLETGPDGRVALTLPNGVSVRVDQLSRILLASAEKLTLERGTLYVDSALSPSPTARLDVFTPTGSVRHIGTQYEVRLLESGVRLRVRDGHVEWRSRTGDVEQSQSGEQLTISKDGSVERLAVPRYGASWDWAVNAAPAIDIEGLPLARFLAWAAREIGREVDYASPQLAAEVGGIVVHGSISGLTPSQALDAVLATTRLRADITDGRIVIDSQSSAED
jgi:ferric-dicitrate binding protein FerR (iron transport regulator)